MIGIMGKDMDMGVQMATMGVLKVEAIIACRTTRPILMPIVTMKGVMGTESTVLVTMNNLTWPSSSTIERINLNRSVSIREINISINPRLRSSAHHLHNSVSEAPTTISGNFRLIQVK